MTLDMKRHNKNINIRVDELTLAYLEYLCNRTGYHISKSEMIRRLIESEYEWAIDVDKRNE